MEANFESNRVKLDALIEGGKWCYSRFLHAMGDASLLNSIAIDCSLVEDSYVWGAECTFFFQGNQERHAESS